MRYRIIEQNGYFYPQYRGWLSWKPMLSPNSGGEDAVKCVDKQAAENYIREYHLRRIKSKRKDIPIVIAEFNLKD